MPIVDGLPRALPEDGEKCVRPGLTPSPWLGAAVTQCQDGSPHQLGCSGGCKEERQARHTGDPCSEELGGVVLGSSELGLWQEVCSGSVSGWNPRAPELSGSHHWLRVPKVLA